MIKINKILIFLLGILFIANIVIWQVSNLPIGIATMGIIVLLIIILSVQSRFTWYLGIIIFFIGFTFNESMIPHLRPVIKTNIFRITKSFAHLGRDHNLIVASKLIPPTLYIVLFFIFLTRYYRVKYRVSKQPKVWTFWNRIF